MDWNGSNIRMDVRIHDVGVDRPRLSLKEFPWRSRVLDIQLFDVLLRHQHFRCLVFCVFRGNKGTKIGRKEIRRDSYGS